MKIERTQKPSGLAYPLSKVKEHLRNTGYDEENGLVSTYISAAVDFIASYTWVNLQSTDYVGYMDIFENFNINMYPVTEVTSIKYYDTNGTLQTMTENVDYYVNLKGKYAEVQFENTFTLRDRPFNNVEVAFKAGYSTWFDIPEDLVNALLLIVADSTEMRQSFSQGMTFTKSDIPMGALAILNNNSKRLFV